MRWNRSRCTPSGHGHRGLDRVGVRHGHDGARRGGGDRGARARSRCELHLGEGLATREAEPRRVALDLAPLGQLAQVAPACVPVHSPKSHSSRPLAARDRAARSPWRWVPRSRGCAPAGRRRPRRPRSSAPRCGRRPRSAWAWPVVGQVQARGPARAAPCRWWASGRGGPAAPGWAAGTGSVGAGAMGPPDRGWLVRRRSRAERGHQRDPCSGVDTLPALEAAGHRRVPALPAPGRVAGAGRPGEAGRLPRTRSTGAGRCPASAIPAARLLVIGPRPGRPRRQPHRPDVHRRPLGRLALRGAAPRRLRQPARARPTATTASS